MKTDLSILLVLLCLSLGLHAQGVDDAVFNAQTYYEGTSRSMAMGNATGAMGGDVTAICINPAGMGLYRAQEFTFTTGLQHSLIHSNFYDNGRNAGKMRLTVPNVGLIFASQFSNYEAVRFVQFGIGFTRTNDFNYRSRAYGLNPNSSMVDAYLQTVNGIDELFDPNTNVSDYLDNYYAYDLSPAWETYLIDQSIDTLGYIEYWSPVPKGDVYQSDELTSTGRGGEWSFALSTNLHDKFFIGTSLGLTRFKHYTERTYTETPGKHSYDFDYWTHYEKLEDTAWGINFKLGIIYYPVSWLRIGAAWHSRTHYYFGEDWSTWTSTQLNNGNGYHKYLSPAFYQTYDFKTPHTFIGSLAFIVDRRGMVTADVEYKNYGSSKFSSDEYSFNDANNDIKEFLKPTFNIRLGTEWRLRQYFLRGGIAYYGSPYGFGEDYGSAKKIAFGVGYATSEVTSWDFAYELTECTSGYTPYSYYENDMNVTGDVIQHKWRNKLMVTLKMKFE